MKQDKQYALHVLKDIIQMFLDLLNVNRAPMEPLQTWKDLQFALFVIRVISVKEV